MEKIKKVLFTATVDSHILHFHIPYLKLFKDKGYEVHVATNGDEQIPYCDVKHKVSFERNPFKINNLKAIKQLKNIINEEKFDIIHCHTPMGSVVTRIAAKKARKSYGTRVIYTAHGFHFYKGAPLLNWIMFYPVEKHLSRVTDDLILINNEDYELALKKFHAKRTHYVPGVGVDSEKFNFEMTEEEKEKLRNEIGIKKDDKVLIYVAELSKRKNQIMAINAMKELVKENSKYKLLLVGKDSLNGKYQQIVKELKLEDNIKFLGYRKDVPKIMKISNIYISTSVQEGLPVNLIEATMCGLPIVVTDCRGNRDVVKEIKNGKIVLMKDYVSLKNDIKNVNIQNNFYNSKTKLPYELDNVTNYFKKIYNENKIVLIIPNCTDLNRGDQALVFETSEVIKETYTGSKVYMMSDGESIQCEKEGIEKFSDILKHPSRFDKKNNNVKYGASLKIKWGIVAIFDYIFTLFILNKVTRFLIYPFLSRKAKHSIDLYKNCDACFVKGGGFIHDYSGGIIGLYTMYYQMFHIILAQKFKKKVYIMPNSFGPFNSEKTKKLVNKTLSKCEYVTARESISADGNRNGLNKNFELYPDLAFFLKKNEDMDVENYLKQKDIDINKNSYVAITVRPYRFPKCDNPLEKYEEYKNTFKQFTIWLNSQGYIPLFVVHTRAENDHENDEKCINEITKMIEDKNLYRILKDDTLSCRELKAIYAKCKFIIGTRFHSVIFSITQGVPAISITYGGNKGDGIMKDINSNMYSIKIENLSFDILKEKFLSLIENKEKFVEDINIYIDKANQKRKELINKINLLK